MKNKQLVDVRSEAKEGQIRSPLELWQRLAGRKTEQKDLKAPDSLMAYYKDRVTYTFIFDGEIASIHFDQSRREIFFSGHNILHLELTQDQKEALEQMKTVLADHPKAKKLFNDYEATLDRYLADNNRWGKDEVKPNPQV